jgi:hypothetical protein
MLSAYPHIDSSYSAVLASKDASKSSQQPTEEHLRLIRTAMRQLEDARTGGKPAGYKTVHVAIADPARWTGSKGLCMGRGTRQPGPRQVRQCSQKGGASRERIEARSGLAGLGSCHADAKVAHRQPGGQPPNTSVLWRRPLFIGRDTDESAAVLLALPHS